MQHIDKDAVFKAIRAVSRARHYEHPLARLWQIVHGAYSTVPQDVSSEYCNAKYVQRVWHVIEDVYATEHLHVAAFLVWYMRTPHSKERYGPEHERYKNPQQMAAFLHNAVVVICTNPNAGHLHRLCRAYDDIPNRRVSFRAPDTPVPDAIVPGAIPQAPELDYRTLMSSVAMILSITLTKCSAREALIHELRTPKYKPRVVLPWGGNQLH